MTIDPKMVYTPREVQEILKISPSTFMRLVRRGDLKASKIGGQYRILGKYLLQIFSPNLEEVTL